MKSSSSSSSSYSLLILLNLCLLLLGLEAREFKKSNGSKEFNVMNFGAVADGKTDNSEAFLSAWKEACDWKGNAEILIPGGTYLLGYASFKGPCQGGMTFQIKGMVKARKGVGNVEDKSWIKFQYVDNLEINGGGVFDGEGPSAWPYNNCNKNPKCISLPRSILFDYVTNSVVRDIKSVNSKNFHINVYKSKNLSFKSITISAPGDSPNTDGIHIGNSDTILIQDSNIGTGDDCVSIGPGSSNIYITRVTCGPGHGISVGSLGKYPNEEDVFALIVKNCTFIGTSNGVRIKTWAPSPSSIAKNFTFDTIFMNEVDNPIIIDQNYCPHGQCNSQAHSQVHIREVNFQNIWGYSTTKNAVSLKCSQSVPCQNIKLERIYLPFHQRTVATTSTCSNVRGWSTGTQVPRPCI